MGNKINPTGFRLGANPSVPWRSRWFADKTYGDWLLEDQRVRTYIQKGLSHAGIAHIDIERKGDRLQVDIHTARPGIVIGRKGAEVDRIRDDLKKMTGKENIQLNVLEISRPELEAPLVAQNIAEQLEGRVAFRRAMRRGLQQTMRAGAQGVRIQVGGRLGGAEMSRTEQYREGRVPLHTLRADIDYGFREAKTQFGRIGVKVWIYRGDVMPSREEKEAEVAKARARAAASGEMIPGPGPSARERGRGGRGRKGREAPRGRGAAVRTQKPGRDAPAGAAAEPEKAPTPAQASTPAEEAPTPAEEAPTPEAAKPGSADASPAEQPGADRAPGEGAGTDDATSPPETADGDRPTEGA